MTGHIKMGAPGDLRDYLLLDNPDNYPRDGANPFAAPVSTAGAYNDLEGWAEFEGADWSAGIGHPFAEDGMLFSTLDTRVRGQVILPPLVDQTDRRQTNASTTDCRNLNTSVAASIVISPAGANRKVAWKIQPNTTYNFGATNKIFAFAFLAIMPKGGSVRVRLLSGATIGAASLVDQTPVITARVELPAYRWCGGHFTGTSNLSSGTYWIEVEALTGSTTLAGGATYTSAETQVWNGSAYGSSAVRPVFTTNWYGMSSAQLSDPRTEFIVRFNSTLYGVFFNTLYKYNAGTKAWTSVGSVGVCTSLAAFGETLYIGREVGNNYMTCSMADSLSTAGENGCFFAVHRGLLWRAVETTVLYSGDGSTWTTVGLVAPQAVSIMNARPIRGMCGMGENMYVATDDGLFYVAPGDFILPVMPWTGGDPPDAFRRANGAVMEEHLGVLYVIADETIYRIDQAHQVMQIWETPDDVTLTMLMARPLALHATKSMLLATFVEERPAGTPDPTRLQTAIYAFTSTGWQHVADVPLAQASAMCYDWKTTTLYVATCTHVVHTLRIVDGATNPWYDATNTFLQDAWLEYGKLYGGRKRLLKDWESVFLDAEGMSADQRIEVYWQDAGSTTWELLGTATANETELRWSNYGTRPESRWIRLGLRLISSDKNKTPRLRAVVVRFVPMINDQFQFMAAIPVHDSQEMPNGTLNPQTQSQMVTHLEGLIKRVPPFIYQDHLLHQQWEVKIANHRLSSMDWEQQPGNVRKVLVYNFTLRQVSDAPYMP